MIREEAILLIEGLYPADSTNEDTARTGNELLEQAKREVNGWRTEPTEVLVRYAQLCSETEARLNARPSIFDR